MPASILGSIALALLVGVGACSRKHESVEEKRRELLTPVDTKKAQAAFEDKLRLFDAQGELLASTQVVAGVTMPRGLRLYSQAPYQWIFRSDRVAASAFDRYFGSRLQPTSVERSKSGSVIFDMARPRDNPKVTPVTVRIVPLLGSLTAAEVVVHQAEPAPVLMTQSQVETKIKEEAKFAR